MADDTPGLGAARGRELATSLNPALTGDWAGWEARRREAMAPLFSQLERDAAIIRDGGSAHPTVTEEDYDAARVRQIITTANIHTMRPDHQTRDGRFEPGDLEGFARQRDAAVAEMTSAPRAVPLSTEEQRAAFDASMAQRTPAQREAYWRQASADYAQERSLGVGQQDLRERFPGRIGEALAQAVEEFGPPLPTVGATTGHVRTPPRPARAAHEPERPSACTTCRHPYRGTPMERGRRGEPTLASADLTPGERATRDRRFAGLSEVARTVDTDPLGVPGRLRELREREGSPYTHHDDGPFNVASRELEGFRADARAAAARYPEDDPVLFQHAAADTAFRSLVAAPNGVRAEYDATTSIARYSSSITVDGRPLDVSRDPRTGAERNPFEAQLARNLARAQIEESAHGAGFTVRPGAYTPLSPDIERFGGWLGTSAGQDYVRAHPSETYNRPHEADATAILEPASPHTAPELGVYPIRGAYMAYRAAEGR